MRQFRLASILAAGLFPNQSFAINWEVQPRISALVSYVDNITLVSTNEQSDTVYQTIPGINVKGEGNRLKAELDYNVYALKYQKNTDADDVFHGGNASLQWATRDDIFLIDARVSQGQQAANPDGVLPPSLEAITNNRTTITTYGVTPRFQYRFGGTAQLLLRGDFSRVEYDGGNVLDKRSDALGYGATLASGSNFQRVDWALNHSVREFNIDEPDRDDYSRRSNILLGYRVSATVRWFGSAGTEEIVSQGVEVFADDGYWDTGLEWNPSSRTSLRASAGERAFGETRSFSFSRRGNFLTVEASYAESITSQAYEQAFNLGSRPDDTDISDLTNVGSDNELFLSKRADVSLKLSSRRNTVSIGIFDEQREFLTSLTEDDYKGGNLSWTHELGRRASLNMGLYYSERLSVDTLEENKITRYNVAVRREIKQDVDASAGYDYSRQRSNIGIDYLQNIIRLGITARF